MDTHTPLRAAAPVASESAPLASHVQAFVKVALAMRFEMRYFDENRWYATTAEDLADTLAPYFPDLLQCLDLMLDGEEIESWLAAYRLVRSSTLDAR